MAHLGPEETDLIGQPTWTFETRDPVTERIRQLVSEYLEKIAADYTGWETLYRDPQDGRYWELTYPTSEYHGGGPPRLTNLTPEQAKSKYASIVDAQAAEEKDE